MFGTTEPVREAHPFDVVCAGPPFLDITFSGLGALPSLGEERLARSVSLTAGGLANVSLGIERSVRPTIGISDNSASATRTTGAEGAVMAIL